MSKQEYRIVSGDESEIHNEPHLDGSRITVRYLFEQVETGGHRPEEIADQHAIDVAEVYEALAYYHTNTEEMERVEQRYERLAKEAEKRSSLRPPNSDRGNK